MSFIGDRYAAKEMLQEVAQLDVRAKTGSTVHIPAKPAEVSLQEYTADVDYLLQLAGYTRYPGQMGSYYRFSSPEVSHIEERYVSRIGDMVSNRVVDEPEHYGYITMDLERGLYTYYMDGEFMTNDMAAVSAETYITDVTGTSAYFSATPGTPPGYAKYAY